jgi:phosphoglycolate phosphatase-like HAD superfamily hydrolase
LSATRLLLFDIDGTLLTCQGRGLRAMHRAIQRLFGKAPVDAVILPQGKTDPILFEEVAAVYGLSPEAVAERVVELHAVYVDLLAEELRDGRPCAPKPGVEPLLAALDRRDDVRLGIVSGNLRPAAQLKLAAVGLVGFFPDGGYGSDGRRRADLVARARRRFEIREGRPFAAGSVWVIGDTPDDVAGGRAHGTRTLAVATGGFDRAALAASGPDWVLDSLADTDHVLDVLCSAE